MRLEIWKIKFQSCVTCMCVNLTNRISSLCNTSKNAGNGEYEKNGEYYFHFFSGTTTQIFPKKVMSTRSQYYYRISNYL